MNKIFFVSCTDDYPTTPSANNTKIGLLAKGLSEQGNHVVVINKYFGARVTNAKVGCQNKTAYLSLSQKGSKFIVSWINLLSVCRIISAKKSNVCPNMVIIAGGSFIHHLILCLFSKFIGVRTGLIFQEWHISFDLGIAHNINSYLFDKCLGRFVDVIFPISEFISIRCRHFKKPMLKVPIVADFNRVASKIQEEQTAQYFMYCAATGYFRIIRFILGSFKLYSGKYPEKAKLKMVLSGNAQKVRDEIRLLNLNDRVEIHSNVSYEQLLQMYAGATGLLIPLDPNSLQDVARFSQKIAEYLSSCRPVLTTAVGEISLYFKHQENAYIASDFTVEAFANLMKLVVENPQEADAIGNFGYELGKKEFDYRYITQQMHNFIVKSYS